MPITINLKQLEYIDGDNLKLDKVNYNFDQLVANGGGPQGTTGYQGTMGYQGTTGYQGLQGTKGDQGFQGVQGAAGADYWGREGGDPTSQTADVLYPKATGAVPTIVKIGHVDSDGVYLPASQSSSNLPAPQLIVNRKSYFRSNISLTSDSVANNSFDFILDSVPDSSGVNNITTLSYGFSQSGTGDKTLIKTYADSHEFVNHTNNSIIASFKGTTQQSSGVISLNEETTITNDLIVQGDLSVLTTYGQHPNPGAPYQDKIATSADATGKLKFQTIQELGGGIPVGTIIGVLPSIFEDSNNFIQEQLNYDASGKFIDFTIGRGINDYDGWYICNGQTWRDSSGVSTSIYNVPELNKYNYVIDDDPSTSQSTQGVAQETNSKIKILGGAEMELDASLSLSSSSGTAYNITSTNDFVGDTVKQDTSGDTHVIRKVPQIIYLGESNLFFQIPGAPNAPYAVTYNFIDTATTGFTTVSEIKSDISGNNYLINVSIIAPQGYGWDTKPATVTSHLTIPSSISATMGQHQINSDGGTPDDTFKFQFIVSSHPSVVQSPVSIGLDSTGHLVDNTITETYTITNNTANGTSLPEQAGGNVVSATGVIGSTQSLTWDFLAPIGKIFKDSNSLSSLPTMTGAYRNSQASRANDFTTTSYTTSTYGGVAHRKATITLQDIDFGNGDTASNNTTISIKLPTWETSPSIFSGPQGYSNTSNPPTSASSTIINDTQNTIYVKLWTQNFNGSTNSNIGVDFATNSTNPLTTFAQAGSTVNSLSNNKITINSGGSFTGNWSFLVNGDSSWFTKLMWTTSGNTTTNPWDAQGNDWEIF